MAAMYPPQQTVPAATVPSTRVELHISCEKLKDMDVFSKSDPIVSVQVKNKDGTWREVRTKVDVYRLLVPCFVSALSLAYPYRAH